MAAFIIVCFSIAAVSMAVFYVNWFMEIYAGLQTSEYTMNLLCWVAIVFVLAGGFAMTIQQAAL